MMTSFPFEIPTVLLQNMEGELCRPGGGRCLGCFDGDGALLDSALMMDFTLGVRGVVMPMGVTVCAFANFPHKEERVAYMFPKVLMWCYTKQGAPIGCLHPFDPAFYTNIGHDYYNENYPYQPRPSTIRSCGGKSGLSYIRSEDRQEILDFYRAHAVHTHDVTAHHYMDPHRIFDMPCMAIYHRDGRLTGCFTFDFVAVDHHTGIYHDLLIPKIVYKDLDTPRQFMTFFISQMDRVERVRILSPDLGLTMLFHSPDTGGNHVYDSCIHEVTRRTMGYMTRIFDVPAYFRM